MKFINRKEVGCIFILVAGLGMLLFCLFRDQLQGRFTYYGTSEMATIAVTSIVACAGLILFVLEKLGAYERHRALSLCVYAAKASILGVVVAAVSFLGGFLFRPHSSFSYGPPGRSWAIGLYRSSTTEPFLFTGEGVDNPILTAEDVTDVEAKFLADPFLVRDSDKYYVFFEVWNVVTDHGDIGVAVSGDGLNWSYSGIVLDEPFCLAYPCVFMWDNDWYMIPDAQHTGEVRLYKAGRFPDKWTFVKTLLKNGLYKDPSVFEYNGRWWLFVGSGDNDVLCLYHAESPLGPWLEHPASPVVDGNPNHARPGGRVLVFDERVVRFTQDCYPYYGNQVWAYEITKLTSNEYLERPTGTRPVLKGFENWNTRGMHTLSAWRLDDEHWIAAVDGR